ncbi:MAG: hypothetical protein ACE14T_11670 [Syntrophales bacterium]
MQSKEKTRIFVGGSILVTLGVLILLNSTGIYGFNKSWPILLIVISIGTLFQNYRDAVGWFIGVVGIIFLVIRNWYVNIGELATYGLPMLLIAVGILVVLRSFKK